MASGNFLIGDDLSVEGFGKYVLPVFEGKGYSVQDKLAVQRSDDNHKTVLVSVVGLGDLEKAIDGMLVEAGKIIDEDQRARGYDKTLAWKHQVSSTHWVPEESGRNVPVETGKYETIGAYQANGTASQLFPSIAQGYLLEGLEAKADSIVEQIRNLLDQRLSDID